MHEHGGRRPRPPAADYRSGRWLIVSIKRGRRRRARIDMRRRKHPLCDFADWSTELVPEAPAEHVYALSGRIAGGVRASTAPF